MSFEIGFPTFGRSPRIRPPERSVPTSEDAGDDRDGAGGQPGGPRRFRSRGAPPRRLRRVGPVHHARGDRTGDREDQADEQGHRAQLGEPGARLGAVRHDRPHLGRPRRPWNRSSPPRARSSPPRNSASRSPPIRGTGPASGLCSLQHHRTRRHRHHDHTLSQRRPRRPRADARRIYTHGDTAGSRERGYLPCTVGLHLRLTDSNSHGRLHAPQGGRATRRSACVAALRRCFGRTGPTRSIVPR